MLLNLITQEQKLSLTWSANYVDYENNLHRYKYDWNINFQTVCFAGYITDICQFYHNMTL
jgi:hypothetical protein